MKKIFIGCGVFVALALGVIGYLAYQVVPALMETIEALELLEIDLEQVDDKYPFDAELQSDLDVVRFEASLDLHLNLKQEFEGFTRSLDEFGTDLDEEERGFFDLGEIVTGAVDQFLPVLVEIPRMLGDARMGPTEFSYYTRLLWATLQSVSMGVAGDELSTLQDEYDTLREAYKEFRRDNPDGWPPLDELIGRFEDHQLKAARDVLAADPQRVLEALGHPVMECMCMRIQSLPLADAVSVKVDGVEVTHDSNPIDDAAPDEP
jgi:hypothetical protein